MTSMNSSAMRVCGILALISAFIIAPIKYAMPFGVLNYAIMTAYVMAIAFCVLDEIKKIES